MLFWASNIGLICLIDIALVNTCLFLPLLKMTVLVTVTKQASSSGSSADCCRPSHSSKLNGATWGCMCQMQGTCRTRANLFRTLGALDSFWDECWDVAGCKLWPACESALLYAGGCGCHWSSPSLHVGAGNGLFLVVRTSAAVNGLQTEQGGQRSA